MSEDPKPGMSHWVMVPPLLMATALAVAIHLADPTLGPMAWGSAWIGAFLMLGVFAVLLRR